MELGAILCGPGGPAATAGRRGSDPLPNCGERTCVSFNLPVSKASLTHHFRVLREAGLIRQDDRGNSRGTTLRREDVDARFPGLLALIASDSALP